MFRSLEKFTQGMAERVGVEPGNFVGVCLALISGLSIMANGAIGKLLAPDLHPFLITFFRSAIITLILFPWFTRNGYDRIRPTRHREQFLNGLIFTLAVVGWFWALPRTPLDMVAAIGFTSQLYAIIGAMLFLGEKPRLWRWIALFVGFIGAMIIVRPGFIELTPGILVLLATAILFSTNRLVIKVIATKDNPETSVVWMAFWATVLTAPLAVIYWKIPDLMQFILIVSIALLTIISHYTLAWALKLGDIGAIEPTTFMRLVWGVILGYFIFHDIPDFFTIFGGLNVLQAVRQKREAQESLGRKLLDLSVGEPKGPALFSARHAASSAVMSDEEVMHAYQYNGSPAVPKFSEQFIAAHVKRHLSEEDVDYLPISGIKPILGLLPLSCGCATQKLTVATTTNPGYPIPADWCAMHPLVDHYALPLTIQNKFRFAKENIKPSTDLILLNYPHNPSGQVATEPWLRELCEYSQAHDVRLFNDAAYFALSHTEESTPLADVANDYPALSWSEAFTAAKLIGNGTGWHVGAMVGSPDFIADIKEIKGKTDTGFVPPMAVGALEALQKDTLGISQVKEIYHERLNLLVNLLSRCGMRSALKPAAGFFSLWEAPTEAFGERIESAEDFNFKMIDEVGVAGVHFPGFLRYAVCADIIAMTSDLETAFRRADVKYR